MSTVELRGIGKKFGDVRVLENVDLEISDGELVCLLGPSGCGKTTTLRLLAGFERPTEGSILLADNVVSSPPMVVPPERRKMGMMFQSYAVWPHMTVFQNVAYGLKAAKTPKDVLSKRAETALELVQMGKFAHRYPGELSGGQQQRVSFARAIVTNPSVLLLDEPLSNLDVSLREEMQAVLRRLHDEVGYTGVYVTHNRTEAMTVADRIVILRDGRIEQVGTPEEVYRLPVSGYAASQLGGVNIIPGVMAGRSVVRVRDRDLDCVNLPGALTGSRVSVFLRPEQVEIETRIDHVPDEDLLHGHVESAVFLGDTTQCTVHIKEWGGTLDIAVSAGIRVKSGDWIRCRVVSAAVIMPSIESERCSDGKVSRECEQPTSVESVPRPI